MKTIARRLGVSVSSVSLWVRDIELSPSQRAALRNKISGGWSANAIAARRRRRLSQEGGRALVRDADPLFVAGIMLFWAEGAKARNEAGRRTRIRSWSASSSVSYGSSTACRTSACGLLAISLRITGSPARDRAFLARHARAPTILSQEVDGEHLFEVQPAKAERQASIWDVQARCLRHGCRSVDLRRDPGVRRLRSARVARLVAELDAFDRDRLAGPVVRVAVGLGDSVDDLHA